MPLDWPNIDPSDSLVATTEILAEFPNKMPWRNPGFKYRNRGTALLGDDGATALFGGYSKNGVEQKYGLCKFFAVAHVDEPEIVVTYDGGIACLLDRNDLGGRSLRDVEADELRVLCKQPGTPRRPLASFP